MTQTQPTDPQRREHPEPFSYLMVLVCLMQIAIPLVYRYVFGGQ